MGEDSLIPFKVSLDKCAVLKQLSSKTVGGVLGQLKPQGYAFTGTAVGEKGPADTASAHLDPNKPQDQRCSDRDNPLQSCPRHGVGSSGSESAPGAHSRSSKRNIWPATSARTRRKSPSAVRRVGSLLVVMTLCCDMLGRIDLPVSRQRRLPALIVPP